MLPLVTRAAQVTRLRSRGLSSGLAQTSPKSTSSVSSTSFGAKSPIMRCAGVWSVMLIPLEGLVVTVTTSSQGGGLHLGECLPFQVTPVPPCGGRRAHTVVVMDNRAQVREFLVSRRERISPAQAGLPAYGGGNRRVKGLRREEVALLAGVSIDYYVRTERGNLAGASDAVLDGIAGALQLDEAER